MSKSKEILPVFKVPFYEDTLLAVSVEKEGKQEVYVAITPICEALGINPETQRRKIRRNPVYEGYFSNVLMTLEDNSNYSREVFVLHITMLNFWLAGIHSNKVKPEFQEKLLRHQREAAYVLYSYFIGPGYAVNPARVKKPDKWYIEREVSKRERNRLTDAIRDNVPDSPNKNKMYINYTNLVYRVIFGKTAKQLRKELGLKRKQLLRDFLTIGELVAVEKAEGIIKALLDLEYGYKYIKKELQKVDWQVIIEKKDREIAEGYLPYEQEQGISAGLLEQGFYLN